MHGAGMLHAEHHDPHSFLSSCGLYSQWPKPKHLIGKPVRHPSTNYIRNDNIKEIKTLVGLADDKDWRQ